MKRIKKKYDKLNQDIKFDNFYSHHKSWGGDTIDDVLKERKKKKNETAN